MLKFEMATLEIVLEEIGGTEQLLEELLKKFRLWLKQQLHLPQDISDQRLKFFICTAKFDFEKAKKRLNVYYTLRLLVPEIYSYYDPFSDGVNQFHKFGQWIILPKLTPKKYRLNICRLLDTDASIFDPWIIGRYSMMMLETCIEEDVIDPHIIIIDCAGVNIGHVLKFTPNVLRKGYSCQEAYGVRIKEIHLINAPKVLNFFMITVKSIVKAKIFSRIHTYTSGIESLDGIIPKSILPVDYGGEQPSMSTLTDMWREKLAGRRDWFLKQEKVTANEFLQPNSTINPYDLFGFFRKISKTRD